MDGIWNSGVNRESTNQLQKDGYRPLRINIASNGNKNPGDASSLGSVDPNTLGTLEGGPHYMLSPTTPDNSHTYGLEFCLANTIMPPAQRFTVPAAGLTVTIWQLVGWSLLVDPAAPVTPVWGALLPQTGVQMLQFYHTFDLNAGAIRFQIAGSTDDVVGGSVFIFMREL